MFSTADLNMMTTEQAITKVAQLLAKTKSDDRAVVATAASDAKNLIEKHKLDALSFDFGDPKSEEEIDARLWACAMSDSVARANGCRVWWDNSTRLHLIGKPTDVAKVNTIYGLLYEEVQSSEEAQKHGIAASYLKQYRRGFVTAIMEKLLVAATTADQNKLEYLTEREIQAKTWLRLFAKGGDLDMKIESVPEEKPDPTIPVVEASHYLMPRLLKLLKLGVPVYLWGPAGSGKTTAAMQAAMALGLESEIDTLDPSTFRSMVQGYMTPTAEHVHTTFTRCWTEGKIYIADECDNAPGHVQTLFNSALANGHAPFAWGNVERQQSFGFVGTGNTPGRPTREFPDRRPMSAAFADRLYFVHWPLDPAIECRAAGLPVPKAPARRKQTVSPQAWVKFVQRLRAWAQGNMPTLMITPRASLVGIKALEIGETPEEVCDALIFRGCDDEMKRKALSAARLEY